MTIIRILYFTAVFVVSGCSSIPQVPIETEYLGEPVATTLDSKIAHYYLKNYLKEVRTNAEFDQRIDLLYQTQNEQLPTREELKNISASFSLDFAAIFFAEHLMMNTENQELLNHFQTTLNLDTKTLYEKPVNAADYQVIFVPGWNYVDNGYLTGSDFAMPRQVVSDLGIQNLLVKTPSNGSVEDIAAVIAETIMQQSSSHKNIIIVGASAAGPAIHLTLGELLSKQQSTHVVSWINLGGILKGSPLVDYFQKWPQKTLTNMVLWYKGWSHEDLLSMSMETSIKRFERLSLSPDLLVINYLALALSGNLSSLTESKYPLIMPEGPNDGMTLLSDVIAPESQTLIAVNSDHYFGQDKRINDKIVALLKTVILINEHSN